MEQIVLLVAVVIALLFIALIGMTGAAEFVICDYFDILGSSALCS